MKEGIGSSVEFVRQAALTSLRGYYGHVWAKLGRGHLSKLNAIMEC